MHGSYRTSNLKFTYFVQSFFILDDLDFPDLSDLFREVTPDSQPSRSLANGVPDPSRLSLNSPGDPGPSGFTAATTTQQSTIANVYLPSFGSASVSSVPSLPPCSHHYT